MKPRLFRGRCRRVWREAWAAGVGGVTSIVLLSLVLHTPLLLPLYCHSECIMMWWRSPVPPENKVMIRHIRDHVLDPPQGEVAEPITPGEMDDPPWVTLGAWSYVESAIRTMFKDKRGGVFVEVGAGDGIFKSHTAWLEARRGWSGLLLEPRPHAYAQLRRRRKAAAAQVCASDYGHTKKEELWSPGGTAGLPQWYQDIALARSTLITYVDDQDKDGSEVTTVQCFTLNSLIWASVGRRRPVDLLLLDTAGGEYRILDTLQQVSVSVMVVRFSLLTDRDLIISSAKQMNLEHQSSGELERDGLLFFSRRSQPKGRPRQEAIKGILQ